MGNNDASDNTKNKATFVKATAAARAVHNDTAAAGGHRGTAQSAGNYDATVKSGLKQLGPSQGSK